MRSPALAALLAAGCGFQTSAAPPDLLALDGGGPAVRFEVVPGPTSVAEHETFSVHAIAHDDSGGVARGYAGTPAVTSDWGDARVVGSAQFTDGEAQLTVALNRETNPADGLAHLQFQDGAVAGQSPGLTVTAPVWKGAPSITFPDGGGGTWDVAVSNPTWIITSSSYLLWYTGEETMPSIGMATSNDGGNWTRAPSNPVLTASSGFATNGVMTEAVVLDGTTYVMLYNGAGPLLESHGLATSSDGAVWAAPTPIVYTPTVACPKFVPPASMVVESPRHYRIYFDSDNGLCTILSSDGGASFGAPQPLAGLVAGGTPLVQAVVRDGSVWRLWFYSNQTEYATSSDGLTWVHSPTSDVGVAPNCVAWSEARQRYEGLSGMGVSMVGAVRP
jgi:hypothetical protein